MLRPIPSFWAKLRLSRATNRISHRRILGAAVTAAALAGGASLGFALQQPPAEPAGLAGVFSEFPPESLSREQFLQLGGNWETWGSETAVEVGKLYTLGALSLDEQRQLLSQLRDRVSTLKLALDDPAYSMIRPQIARLYGPLSRRVRLASAALELLNTDRSSVDTVVAKQVVIAESASAVRKTLSDLVKELEKIQGGAAWIEFLNPAAIRNALDSDNPQTALAEVQNRLDPVSGELGDSQRQFLRRDGFRNLARAIREYQALSELPDVPAADEAVRQRLAELFQALDDHEALPSDATADAILAASRRLRVIAGAAADPLEELLYIYYSNYNLRLVADESFLSKLIAMQDVECGPVRDCVLGATVRGTQTTATDVDLELLPSADSAQFRIQLDGVSNSRTTGSTSQATIASVGTHYFHATKQVYFDGERFSTGPADVSVNPNIRNVGASTKYDNLFFGLFKSHIRRKALTEANKRLGFARSHAANRIRENLLPEFNGSIDQKFGELSDQLAGPNGLRGRADRLGVNPRVISTRTTSDRFLYDLQIRDEGKLAGSPPLVGATRDNGFTLQIHETLLNNVADEWNFAGRVMTTDEVKLEMEEWFSTLLGRDVKFTTNEPRAEGPAAAPEDQVTTLVFAETDPIRFRATGGGLVLILRAGIREEGRDEIPPQIVEVPLNLKVVNRQIEIERGVVKVSPLQRTLNRALQITRAGVMRKKIEQSLTGGTRDATILVDRGERGGPVTVEVQRIEAEAGWVTVFGR